MPDYRNRKKLEDDEVARKLQERRETERATAAARMSRVAEVGRGVGGLVSGAAKTMAGGLTAFPFRTGGLVTEGLSEMETGARQIGGMGRTMLAPAAAATPIFPAAASPMTSDRIGETRPLAATTETPRGMTTALPTERPRRMVGGIARTAPVAEPEYDVLGQDQGVTAWRDRATGGLNITGESPATMEGVGGVSGTAPVRAGDYAREMNEYYKSLNDRDAFMRQVDKQIDALESSGLLKRQYRGTWKSPGGGTYDEYKGPSKEVLTHLTGLMQLKGEMAGGLLKERTTKKVAELGLEEKKMSLEERRLFHIESLAEKAESRAERGERTQIERDKLNQKIREFAKDSDMRDPINVMKLASAISPKTKRTTYDPETQAPTVSEEPDVRMGLRMLKGMGFDIPDTVFGQPSGNMSALRESAIAQLTKDKKPLTEANIKYVMERLGR